MGSLQETSMAEFVYLLCALTSVFCAGMLIRSYLRSRVGLLLWSSLCFVGLAVNNVLLFIDLIVVPQSDLSMWRTFSSVMGMTLMAFGLIWEAK
jgi:hypothetical protein